MAHPVVNWQILTAEPEKAEHFYARLFGWTFTHDAGLGCWHVDTGSVDGIPGILWPIPPGHGKPLVQLFVRVENVAHHVARALALGARPVVPLTRLPEGDSVAVLADPLGIPFAVIGPGGA
jgi:predicted enzyme related to lactoylglutathione lyase